MQKMKQKHNLHESYSMTSDFLINKIALSAQFYSFIIIEYNIRPRNRINLALHVYFHVFLQIAWTAKFTFALRTIEAWLLMRQTMLTQIGSGRKSFAAVDTLERLNACVYGRVSIQLWLLRESFATNVA